MRLEVGGSVAVLEGTVEATVEVTNRGDADVSVLDVRGELFGRHDAAALGTGVAAGATRRVLLRFPGAVPRPGLHALALRLDYDWATPGRPRAGASQRAYLLVGLGGAVQPAVTLQAHDVRLDNRADLPVTVASADGAPHRVRLRALTPRGINPWGSHTDLDVPARGDVRATLPLLRGGAPRPSRQGVLVIATTLDGEVERTTVGTAVVEVTADWWWISALRPWLFGAAAALLLAAAAVEWRSSPSRSPPPDGPPTTSG